MSAQDSPGFHESLCGCLDNKGICFDVLLVCQGCQIGRQCSAIDNIPNDMSRMWCYVACYLGGLSFLPICIRCKVSDKFSLGENFCVSCICGFCCCPLSLCQTGRELQYRNIPPGSCLCNEAAEGANTTSSAKNDNNNQGAPPPGQSSSMS